MISNERKLEILEENGRIDWETYTYLNHFDTNECGLDGLKELIETCGRNNIEVYGTFGFSSNQDFNDIRKMYNVDERKVIYLGTYHGKTLIVNGYGDELITGDDRIYLIVK